MGRESFSSPPPRSREEGTLWHMRWRPQAWRLAIAVSCTYTVYAVWLSHNHFIGANAEPPAGEIVIGEQRGEEEEEGRITTFIKEAYKGSQAARRGRTELFACILQKRERRKRCEEGFLPFLFPLFYPPLLFCSVL